MVLRPSCVPKIAFFDSGVGGLTVMAECRKRLPNSVFYYYGDNARAPYGNLPPERIYHYAKQAFEEIASLNVSAAVIACNTVTALCIEEFRRNYSFPIVGAEPAILQAAKQGGEIYVLTTRATNGSLRFQMLCARARQRYPYTEITPIACDGLAGGIEKELFGKGQADLSCLPSGNPTGVVLGCTHYVYKKVEIANRYHCPVYDGNEGIANRLCKILQTSTEFDKKLAVSPQNYFLGSGQVGNKSIYEQMFAHISH